MTRRRFLPEYVSSFKDRHGKERLRFRRKGFAGGYFKSALGTEDFRIEYRAFMDASETVAVAVDRAVPGTIADLVARYFATPTRLGPTVITQSKVRSIVGRFSEEYGKLPVARVGFEHIDAIVMAKMQRNMVQTSRGLRPIGGPVAAGKLRKELVRLFNFAVKLRMIPTNPVLLADHVKLSVEQRSAGYHTWTEDEIDQYRARHQLGTNARLALELLLWTGQRRSDAIRMGRQHIVDGRIKVVQDKTGKVLWIAVAPQLLEAIVAMPAAKNHLCFLINEQGRPFTRAGFGNWFRDKCDSAGLPQCTAHGLRKAIMRRMAELNQGNQTMKAVSGHRKDEEVARYTEAANQRSMADDAIGILARWEMSNRAERLDTNSSESG